MGSSTGVIESNYGIKFGTGTTLDAYEEGTLDGNSNSFKTAAIGQMQLTTTYNTIDIYKNR